MEDPDEPQTLIEPLPPSAYSNEGLVDLALELHARSCKYPLAENLHERAIEARKELLYRLSYLDPNQS